MRKWKRFVPEPKPVTNDEWRLELPGGNWASVSRESEREKRWWCWAIVSGGIRVEAVEPPFREVLKHAESLLEKNLAAVKAMLAGNGQTDFPAAVDPVAAIERGE